MGKKPIEVANLRDKNGEVKKEYRKGDADDSRPSKRNTNNVKKRDREDNDHQTEAAVIAPPLSDAQVFENTLYQINSEIMPEVRARGETAIQVIAYNNADQHTKALMLEEVLTFAAIPPVERKKQAQEAGLTVEQPKNNAHSDNYSITVDVPVKNKKTGAELKDPKSGKVITEPHQIDIVKDGKLQPLDTKDQGHYIKFVGNKAASARTELEESRKQAAAAGQKLPPKKVGQTFDISHYTEDYEGASLKGSEVPETVMSAYMADVSVDYCKHSGIYPHVLQEDPRIVKMVDAAIDSGKLPQFYGNYNMGLRGDIADKNASLYSEGAHLTISNHFDGAVATDKKGKPYYPQNGTFGQVNPDVEASKIAGRYILGEVDVRGVVNEGGRDNTLISSKRGAQQVAESPFILMENGNGYSKVEADKLELASNVRQQAYSIFNGVVKLNLANGNTLYNSPQTLLASNELGAGGKQIKPEQMLAHYQYPSANPTPLEQAIAQNPSTPNGTGELLTATKPHSPTDLAAAAGFAPENPQPEKAIPVRDQILAAAENTGSRIKQYVSAQGDALSEMISGAFARAEENKQPEAAVAQVEPVKEQPVVSEPTTPVVAMAEPAAPIVTQPEPVAPSAPAVAAMPIAVVPAPVEQAPEAAPVPQQEVAAVQPAKTDNPFNVEQAVAKADIQPVEAKPESPEEKEHRISAEEEAFIKEMFAKFNPEHGKPIIVKRTYDELSPKEREATVFVQTVLDKLDYLEIRESELGHVAGGKTDKAVRKLQDDSDIKIDGVVGRVTYGKMEERVEKEIAHNPNMRSELLEMAKNYKAAEQEEARRLAGEFNSQPKQEPADVSRPPTELAALSQRSTGRDGAPS